MFDTDILDYLRKATADLRVALVDVGPRQDCRRAVDRIEILARDLDARIDAVGASPSPGRFRSAHRRAATCAAVLAASDLPIETRRSALSTLHRQIALFQTLRAQGKRRVLH